MKKGSVLKLTRELGIRQVTTKEQPEEMAGRPSSEILQSKRISTKVQFNNPFQFFSGLFVVLLTLSVFGAEAQTVLKGKVVEKVTKLPVPFATIIYSNHSHTSGVIADVNGEFIINDAVVDQITVSCVGYRSYVMPIAQPLPRTGIVVELETAVVQMRELVVTPAGNPALPLIRKAVENRKKNDFEQYPNYSYRCYFKTILDARLSGDTAVKDSSRIKIKQRIAKRAPFISESVLLSRKKDKRSESRIIAQTTSGVKDPLFAQSFVTVFHHAVSFYKNSISLFETPINDDRAVVEYQGPLSDNCIDSYTYELEDKYTTATDTVFVISFHPKKGSTFNGLKGKMFISSRAYAIKHIVVEPAETGLISFKFRQDYNLVQGKWFPTDLNEEITWLNSRGKYKSVIKPVYIIRSSIDSIRFAAEGARIGFEKVYVDKSSLKNSEQILATVRCDTLSQRELNTYRYMDTIGRKYNFDKWARLYPALMNGRIPLKYVDLDINSLLNYNRYEGERPGLGLVTNDLLSGVFSAGVHAGYGFRDKELKYGAHLAVMLNRYHELQLRLSYSNDLREAGTEMSALTPSLTVSDYFKSYLGERYDKLIQKKLTATLRPLPYVMLGISVSSNKYMSLFDYTYKSATPTAFRTDEIVFSLRYAPGEELGSVGSYRIVNYSGNPVLNFDYSRALDLFGKSDYHFQRIEASLDFTAYNGKLGQSDFRLMTGYIDRNLPYELMFTGEGSKNNSIPLLIKNSFQTMKPYEFLSDKYLHLFYSHNFGSLLFKTPKFNPQFILVQNTGWGSLRNPSYYGIDFRTQEKIYLESGLVINNILKINYLNIVYLNLGAGGFYRYGSYRNHLLQDNIAIKCSLTLSLK